jgi:hypothetical protein
MGHFKALRQAQGKLNHRVDFPQRLLAVYPELVEGLRGDPLDFRITLKLKKVNPLNSS